MKKNLKIIDDTLSNRIISGFVCPLMNSLSECGFIRDYRVDYENGVIRVSDITYNLVAEKINDCGFQVLTEQLWLLNSETDNLLIDEKEESW